MEFIYLIKESKELRCVLIKGAPDSASSFLLLYSSFPVKGQTWHAVGINELGIFRPLKKYPPEMIVGPLTPFNPFPPCS